MRITRRKTLSALVLSLLLLFTAALSSCGGVDDENPVVGLTAAFLGGDVTTTDHEFTKDEFYIVASYEDGTFEEGITDYELEVKGLMSGYYVLDFTYKGYTHETYIRCNIPIYPSDFKDGDGTEP